MARVVRSNSFASWLMVKVCAGMATVAKKGLFGGVTGATAGFRRDPYNGALDS
jgi:hypothetical protein